MRLLKVTEEYCADSEQEAREAIENFRKESLEKGYVLGACGFTYKDKKSRGEIIGEAWVLKVVKIYGKVWE